MRSHALRAFCLSALAAALAPCSARAGGTLLRFDFDDGRSWPDARTGPVGTIDIPGGRDPSGGLLLAGGGPPATLRSGPLRMKNAETNPGKITLAFSLSASAARPVRVRVESFDERKQRTGGLEAVVFPAAPDFYQRFAVDLSAMTPAGGGAFRPTDPHVGFAFGFADSEGWGTGGHELRLDNVHYATPAYYVAPKGSDAADGRTEATALATPQKAVDRAKPGDIIVLMAGTYPSGRSAVAFAHGGTPAAWVTLKSYPGHTPVLLNETWNCVTIGGNAGRSGPEERPAVAYVEVRGLHVRGNADVADKRYPDAMNKSDPRTNSNGISVEGRKGKEAHPPHHLRIADNRVELCSGGGISVCNADWVAVENNVVLNNCWWMVYAGSGVSMLGGSNFDAVEGGHRFLIRGNTVAGNRCFLKWAKIGKFSDGNGIIIDSVRRYTGRVLVANNVSVNNGGSGIHSFKSERVDIVNNTAYLNGATPELRWGQIFVQSSTDVRVVNNILWARDGQPVNTVGPNLTDKGNSRVVRANNLYFGGGHPPIMGDRDRVADPLFVNPSTDPAVADFRLRPGSPALAAGRWDPFTPAADRDGKVRPRTGPPDLGAYQHEDRPPQTDATP